MPRSYKVRYNTYKYKIGGAIYEFKPRELIGYTGESCPKCGRVRVEEYTDGTKVCEKCQWNLTINDYDYDYEEKMDELFLKQHKN